MRLDTHLHVMLKPFMGRPATEPETLLADLARFNLDGGWISSVEALTTRDLAVQKKSNDALADLVRKFPGRLAGLATVEPGEMEDAAREVERCIQELGLIGIKLHPWLQAFSVTHPGLDLIMAAAGNLNVPVLFHDGTPPYATPCQIAWLARKHPRTKVIFGHCGLADLWPDAVAGARENPNIYLQPTGAPPMAIRAALNALGPGRLLFGSDGGFGTARMIGYALAKYRSVLTDDMMDQILIRNPPIIKQETVDAKS
ncbi:MAG: amidohydrolase family protein [Phycisphaerae bacterium]